MGKKFEELNVIDDYLMANLTADSQVGEAAGRILVSTLLQRPVGKVKINSQKVIPGIPSESRGIRMDVEVEEFVENEEKARMNVYDIEPHLQRDFDMPRHNRFYQAKIDHSHMKPGDDDFEHLPNLYVITISNYDIFKEDYMMYTVYNRCEELPDMEYDDGLRFIYFYTRGHKGGNAEIKRLLEYLENSTVDYATDEPTRKLHECVQYVKQSVELRKKYMTWDMYIERLKAEERKNGEQQGIQQGMQSLVNSLRPFIGDFEQLYQAVIANEIYANVTKEEVAKYYNN